MTDDPIAQAERDRDYANQMTLALLDALKPFRPTPAHVTVDACVKLLAGHIAVLPEDQRRRCEQHVLRNLTINIDYFLANPIVKPVKPS
jgi:hypothetical protein